MHFQEFFAAHTSNNKAKTATKAKHAFASSDYDFFNFSMIQSFSAEIIIIIANFLILTANIVHYNLTL